jgi:hypothetical protein
MFPKWLQRCVLAGTVAAGGACTAYRFRADAMPMSVAQPVAHAAPVPDVSAITKAVVATLPARMREGAHSVEGRLGELSSWRHMDAHTFATTPWPRVLADVIALHDQRSLDMLLKNEDVACWWVTEDHLVAAVRAGMQVDKMLYHVPGWGCQDPLHACVRRAICAGVAAGPSAVPSLEGLLKQQADGQKPASAADAFLFWARVAVAAVPEALDAVVHKVQGARLEDMALFAAIVDPKDSLSPWSMQDYHDTFDHYVQPLGAFQRGVACADIMADVVDADRSCEGSLADAAAAIACSRVALNKDVSPAVWALVPGSVKEVTLPRLFAFAQCTHPRVLEDLLATPAGRRGLVRAAVETNNLALLRTLVGTLTVQQDPLATRQAVVLACRLQRPEALQLMLSQSAFVEALSLTNRM